MTPAMTKIEQDDWLTDELMQRAKKLIEDTFGIVSQGTVYTVSRALHLAEKRGEERARTAMLALIDYKRDEAETFRVGALIGGSDNWSARGAISACNDLSRAIRSGS